MALCSLSMSAQFYLGGTVGFDTASSKDKTVDPATTTSVSTITVSPDVGYIISDVLSAGVRLNLAFGSTAAKAKTNGLGFNPYARYNVLTWNDFILQAEGGISFNHGKTTTPGIAGRTESVNNAFSLYVRPVLSYPLSDRICIEANLNICSFALTTTAAKTTNIPETGASTVTADDVYTEFGLMATSDRIFDNDFLGLASVNGIGFVNIGFTYNF